MATIWEISKEVKELLDMAEENDWDFSLIQDSIEGAGFDDKLNDWLKAIYNAEGTAKMLKEQKEALAERQKVFENKAKNMKAGLHLVLQNLDIKKYQAPLGTLSRSDLGQEVKFNESELSDDYIIYDTVRTVDKQKVIADMDAGIDVKGAYYETKPERFSIRKK